MSGMSTNKKLAQNDGFLNSAYDKYLLPTMLTPLGVSLNGIFDGIIVGQKLGAESFAVISLCMPIYLFMCTIGSLIGSGGFIVSARAIGTGDIKKSVRVFNTAALYMVIVSLSVALLGLLSLNSLAGILSGNGDLYESVKTYSRIIFIGALPKMFLYIPLFYLRLDGKNSRATMITLIMTAVNVILNLFFIYTLEMGIGGAALANVSAAFIACVAGALALTKTENFRFVFQFEPASLFLKIVKNGSPAALNNLASALKMLFLNSVMLSAGGSVLVSVFAVLNNVNEIALSIVDGVPQTAAPIIGVYSAERNNDGIRILIKRAFERGIIMAAVFGAVVTVTAKPIGLLFGVSYDMNLPMLCLSAGILLACVNTILVVYYTASGKIAIANVMTVSRVFVFPALAVTAVIKTGGFIWLFLPMAEFLTLLLFAMLLIMRHILIHSGLFFKKKSDSKKNISPILLLDDSEKQSGGVLDFSVTSNYDDICNASEQISEFCESNMLSLEDTMKISLAIEEMLSLMAQKCYDGAENKHFDLRAFVSEGNTGIRIRCLGKRYNPLYLVEDAEAEEENLGIRIILGIAKSVEYQYVLGTNSLLIII